MWARAVEVMLGLWLWISPFVFGHYGRLAGLVWSDLLSGAAVILLALLSFVSPLRRAHLLSLVVGAWLVGFGRLGFAHPAPPGAQNEMLVGLVLVLMAIVPSESSRPPLAWRQYLEQEARRTTSEPGARGAATPQPGARDDAR